MKKLKYQITLNGEPVAVKHAWNAALREVENLAKLRGTEVGEQYMRRIYAERVDIVGEYKTPERGSYVWAGDNGTVCTFEIKAINLSEYLSQ
jgi:hypothetical protein